MLNVIQFHDCFYISLKVRTIIGDNLLGCTLCRKMMLFSMNQVTRLAFNTEQEAVSTYLVKYSIATKIYSCPFEALGLFVQSHLCPRLRKAMVRSCCIAHQVARDSNLLVFGNHGNSSQSLHNLFLQCSNSTLSLRSFWLTFFHSYKDLKFLFG